jgi:integrase/recombinase XerD
MPISPLRQRMIGDMTARHFSEKAQKDYIRCVKNLAAFIGRPPETARPQRICGSTASISSRARSEPPA